MRLAAAGASTSSSSASSTLFAEDEAELLAEAAEAEEAWVRAGRDEAEEAYGDYQLVVDAIADRLLDVRETYAATLDADAGRRRTAGRSTRGAARRFRRYPRWWPTSSPETRCGKEPCAASRRRASPRSEF